MLHALSAGLATGKISHTMLLGVAALLAGGGALAGGVASKVTSPGKVDTENLKDQYLRDKLERELVKTRREAEWDTRPATGQPPGKTMRLM